MKNEDNKRITIGDIKLFGSMATILVGLVLAYSSITAQLSVAKVEQDDTQSRLSGLETKEQTMNDELIHLSTIIEVAQKNGQLTLKPKKNTIAAILSPVPTPYPTPVQFAYIPPSITVHEQEPAGSSANVVITQHQQPTPVPTVQPKPSTQPMPSIIDSVSSLVTNLLTGNK